jgi:hypothetical protein
MRLAVLADALEEVGAAEDGEASGPQGGCGKGEARLYRPRSPTLKINGSEEWIRPHLVCLYLEVCGGAGRDSLLQPRQTRLDCIKTTTEGHVLGKCLNCCGEALRPFRFLSLYLAPNNEPKKE